MDSFDRLEFWTHVDRSAGVNQCWPWMLRRSKRSGFGLWHVDGRQHLAHKLAWELTHGPITSPNLTVGHHCDNPPCCNPAHLYLSATVEATSSLCARRTAPPAGPRVTAVITARVVRREYLDAA